jgi:DNA-binding transcriptional MerR regulator
MGTLYSIGELARRTGLTVKAIRFYSDRGLVPPTDRSPAGYRLYGSAAVARLELVRTLRELGLDIATIRRVLHEDADLPEVAATHAEALAVQIRILQARHAVLTAIARRGTEEMDAVMTTLSEGKQLIDAFLDQAFAGQFAGVRQSMTPQLPQHPTPEQVEAWLQLAELAKDQGFAASLTRMVRQHSVRDFSALITDDVLHIDPRSPEAEAIVRDYDKEELLAWLKTANDPRRHAYLERLAVVNGWAAPVSPAPVFEWYTQALVGSLN